ncbi:MAG TPA: tRNA (adenosine(37)-N6)-dimethylallyltransferase MiaA [Candidatus Angelobacter sp.]|nr:tRNA (adenosine(37)-N6)-dimethylallyltransferase MiaA [Candidatus Angelobacter sp.]
MTAPLLVIVGPTGSGKTALSLHVAQKMRGEIVSCDSVAVYRELEIGTAKPSREERRMVPHHLIDIAEPTEVVTAGDYSRLARKAITEISARGHLPVVVGGTGLYLRALLEGLFAGPPRSEELRARLRERARERGAQYLHRMLRRLDANSANAVHANDVAKVVRALEVSLSARRPMTDLWRQGRDPLLGYRILRLGLNPSRENLYQQINERAGKMFAGGLIEETRALRERYGSNARPLDSLGYKQATQFLLGELSLPETIAAAQQAHRNYAKRQITWFRREPDVHWMAGFGTDAAVQKRGMEWIGKQL